VAAECAGVERDGDDEAVRYWLDTEFIERGSENPILLLSVGIVAEDGREFYYEHPNARERVNEDYRDYNDRWLIDNVRPHLHGGLGSGPNPFWSRDPAKEIKEFCSVGGKPEFWAYFADYDWVVFCQIFGRMIDLPDGWPMYCLDLKQSMKLLGVGRELLPLQTPEEEHGALNDARWTKAAWAIVHSVNGVHRIVSPGAVQCGADYPNMRSTEIHTNVTCPSCTNG
jgi:hypothetical protein